MVEAPTRAVAVSESSSLKRMRQLLARVPETLAKNHKAFDGPTGRVSGFGAGDAYPQIWLRDSAWIVDAAAASYPIETLTSWLDLHLAMAETGGRLRDWVAKGSASAFREWAPQAEERGGIAFDTNTNESDQESSAALAVCRVERILGPANEVGAKARAARIERAVVAMDALMRDRFDRPSGLVWSGLTADWGDVSPIYPDQRAIYRDAKTPRTLALYTNVMAYAAHDCLANLAGSPATRTRLGLRAQEIRARIRSAFWMEDPGFFRSHVTLDPEPKGFEDDATRFALGGNALAALFGVADDSQAASIFEAAERLRVAGEFSTVSTTLIPPYANGVFQHPSMREAFRYQNGGQWDWFGAALVQAEFERGYSERGRIHLNQIISRILRAGPGIHEWYGQDGLPYGSPAYAAAATALHNAVVKGLLGISSTDTGYRIVIRTGATLAPVEIPEEATGRRLMVSQTVSAEAIHFQVDSNVPVSEACSVIPPGHTPTSLAGVDAVAPQGIRRQGADTLICADLSRVPMPARMRFGITPSR